MLELNIKGNDIAELYANLTNTFIVMSRGADSTLVRKPVEQPIVADTETATEVVSEANLAVAEPNPAVIEPPKKRGRPPKAPVTIEATATEVVDDDPLGLSDAKPAETVPELTLDDMRDRVKAIIKAHSEDRGNKMDVSIAYVRKLFAPFGVKLAAELKPEQFAEFWSASEAYLDGTAK